MSERAMARYGKGKQAWREEEIAKLKKWIECHTAEEIKAKTVFLLNTIMVEGFYAVFYPAEFNDLVKDKGLKVGCKPTIKEAED